MRCRIICLQHGFRPGSFGRGTQREDSDRKIPFSLTSPVVASPTTQERSSSFFTASKSVPAYRTRTEDLPAGRPTQNLPSPGPSG